MHLVSQQDADELHPSNAMSMLAKSAAVGLSTFMRCVTEHLVEAFFFASFYRCLTGENHVGFDQRQDSMHEFKARHYCCTKLRIAKP